MRALLFAGALGIDRVYQVTVPPMSTLRVRVDPTSAGFNPSIALVDNAANCGPTGRQWVAAIDAAGANEDENLYYDNGGAADVTLYVVVDGATTSDGFDLHITLNPTRNGSTIDTAARSCRSIQQVRPTADSGVYWIVTRTDVLADAGGAIETFCDMDSDQGGWTLVGSISGPTSDIDRRWLVIERNTNLLKNPASFPSINFASIHANELAVLHAKEMRLTSLDRTQWTRWDLPDGRRLDTWWNFDAGYTAVSTSAQLQVTVMNSDGGTALCIQNIYGIARRRSAGGAYPATELPNDAGPVPGDLCMSVGTLQTGSDGGGWYQSGEGFDAPGQSGAWPNTILDAGPYLHVWLR
jgi:hypothetical protein